MFEVKLYTFSKKVKSTARPSTDGATFNCNLKVATDIISPQLEFANVSNIFDYNYAYIEVFKRYYFINNWTFDRGMWIASCVVDHLATLKPYIASSDLYVLRSSAEYDGNIIDTKYPSTTNFTYQIQTFTPFTPAVPTISDGRFVVGVVSKNANYGSLEYLAFDLAGMTQLLSYLVDDDFLSSKGFVNNAEGFTIAFQKSIINPFQYIKSCVWIPTALLGGGTYQESTTIFSWTIPVRSLRLSLPYAKITRTITDIIKHPQTASRGNFVNIEPYTQAYLRVLPFGFISLNTAELSKATSMELIVNTDIQGYSKLSIKMNDIIVKEVTARVGVPLELSQVTSEKAEAVAGILTGIVLAGAGYSMGLPELIVGGAGGFGGGIGSAVNTIMGHRELKSSGSNGSFVDLTENAGYIYYIFSDLVDADNSNNGRPLCKVRKPSALGGYMLIEHGLIECPYTDIEKERTRIDLESGFYFE